METLERTVDPIPLNFIPTQTFIIQHIPIKRLFDICFSLLVLLLGLPLFLLIGILVSFSVKGKIFYAQERLGRGGIIFRCYKFRTMRIGADTYLKALLEKDPLLKKEWEANHKLKNDPRVTKVGAFLRKTSLDEIPQFWNVLKGDLSIVGPRPIVKEELARYGKHASLLLSVRPGITGPWQISGRSDTSYQQRVALDIEYIQKRSFWKDFLITVKTVPSMIASRGAY